jgi:putative FmdB family regulatory protein
MPLYEYECEKCAQRFERIQKFSDPPIETCPSCQGAVRKLLSSPAIQFKGTGWYITDYAKKTGGEPAKAADTKSGDSGGKTETKPEAKPTETKTESKPAAKSE